MLVPQAVASHFARAVDLFRDPQAKETQKTQFRALLALLKIEAVTLRADGARVLVNGAVVEGTACPPLPQRLDLHGVDEIVIPRDPPPAELFALLKTLADQPTDEELSVRLRRSGAQRISVVAAPPIPAAGEARPSSRPQRRERIVINEDLSTTPAAPGDFGTAGLPHGEAMKDIASVPVAGVPTVTHDAPGPLLQADSSDGVEPPPAAAHAAPPAAPDPAPRPELPPARPGESGDLLAQLERGPGARNLADLLADLSREIEVALDGGRIEQALRIVAAIVRREEKTRDAAARRPYAIALKRVYSKRLLEALAQLVQIPAHETDAVAALQRAGAVGVEVLLDLLIASPTAGERQAVFNALTKMKEGTDQLVHMLAHPQWFVVRNVAGLVGELGLDEGVPALARQLDHADVRVRKAVALALAKIGSRTAADPLRRALRDKSPEVRMQAALGVGGRKSGALAMPLVVAVEQEKDEAVERELILALGRIGSADAVQAMIRFAQPTGKLFGRKSTELRVAVVEALRLAGTAAAVGTLQGLTGDSDKQVRAAAQAALVELRATRASAKRG